MPVWLTAFLMALPVGSLVEYWGHRAMHSWLLRKRHARHHQAGAGQGWLGEFFDYTVGSLFFLLAGFLYSSEAGWGFAAGALAFAAFAAYSHQLQHEHPELCFWLSRPVHFLHHQNHMWHHNFGISLDIWDRVFGTYQHVEWTQPLARGRRMWSQFLQIKWL